MPIGCQVAITPVLNEFTRINPKKVLDVGIGSGTFGLLFREFSDIMNERYDKNTWQARIDGVEVWDKYITPSHEWWYDNLYITDMLKFKPEVHYDLVYMGDFIEHLEKNTSLGLLKVMKTWADNIIVTTPVWEADVPYDPHDNPYEHHLSHWTPNDLPGFRIIMENPLVAIWSKN